MVEENRTTEIAQKSQTSSNSVGQAAEPALQPITPEDQPAPEPPRKNTEPHKKNPLRVAVVASTDLSRYERQYLRVAGTAALGAIVAAVFIYFQFKGLSDQNAILSSQAISAASSAAIGELNTRKQLELAEKQTKNFTKIAERTGTQAVATTRLATTSESEFRATVQLLTDGVILRPGIDMGGGIIPTTPSIRIQNFGRTAAEHAELCIDRGLYRPATFMSLPDCLADVSKNGGETARIASPSTPVLLPGIPVERYAVEYGFSETDRQDLKNQKAAFFVFGYVRYNDGVSKRPRETKFCSRLSSDLKTFESCGFYNDRT